MERTISTLSVLEDLESSKGGSATDQLVRELALVIWLVILDLVVVLLGII